MRERERARAREREKILLKIYSTLIFPQITNNWLSDGIICVEAEGTDIVGVAAAAAIFAQTIELNRCAYYGTKEYIWNIK